MEIINGKDLVNMKFIKTEDGLLKEYKTQGRFIPEKNGNYWYISLCGDVYFSCNNTECDDYVIAHNLVFRTRDECEDYKLFLEQLDEYKTDFSKEEWENNRIRKYYIFYDYGYHEVKTDFSSVWKVQGTVYFTKENIKKFIEVVGEERIKKYMFGSRV